MEKLGHFVRLLEDRQLLAGRLRGTFHLLVGRKISDASGAAVSTGATWREVAALFKELAIDPKLMHEVGLNPATNSPRDRRRAWYSTIGAAQPDSVTARTEAEALIPALEPLGYRFGPAPTPSPPSLSSPPEPPPPPEPEPEPPEHDTSGPIPPRRPRGRPKKQ